MGVIWERLAGDTSKFAFKVSFSRDPDGGCCVTPEEADSWGSFQLWVNGHNLCLHLVDGTVVDSCSWYLLHLLEWFAKNWDYFLHEERLPGRVAGADARDSLRATRSPSLTFSEGKADAWEERWFDWWSRHSLSACRNGAIFPDVVIRRWQDLIEFSWAGTKLPGLPEGLEFAVAEGAVRLRPNDVAGPLHSVVSDAAQFLLQKNQSSERVQRLVKRLQEVAAPNEKVQETRCALLAGLGGDADEMLAAWQKAVGSLRRALDGVVEAVLGVETGALVIEGTCQAALMFGSVAPRVTQNDVVVLASRLIDLYDSNGDSVELEKIVSREDLSQEEEPWEQGYRLALRTLEELGLPEPSDRCVDVERVLKLLGINLEEIQLDDHRVRGVAVASPKHKPTICVNVRYRINAADKSKRFTLAHELCHLLYDRRLGSRLAVASGPWAPADVEKRANAFAAMFLMPPSLVMKAIGESGLSIIEDDGVAAVSDALRVSRSSLVDHLYNLGIIEESERDTLRESSLN